jgi:cobalt-zinc-cadmium efflux system outer membrane protein
MRNFTKRLGRSVWLSLALAGHPVASTAQDNVIELTLRDAEQRLQASNRELRLARRVFEAAQANTVTAGARPNPNLSLGVAAINPTYGVGGGSFRDKTVDSSVRLDQLIERGDKRELRLNAARRSESAASQDYVEVLRQQRLALRAAYYDLAFVQDKVAVTTDNVALFEGSLRAAELRLKAGDIAAADVARLRVDALRAQNDARTAEAERRRAQVALAYLMGAEGEAPRLRAVDPWPAAEALGDPRVSDEMVDRRPDVRAARSRVDAAAGTRDLARSLRTRDVTVGFGYDHYPVSPNYALGSGAGTGSTYGVFVSLPLFARYYYEGEIQRAEVDYSASLDALERARAQARSELGRTGSDLQAAAERLARYDGSLLAEARKAAESAEYAYKNGAIGVMDLLDSRRTLRAIQIDAAAARNEYAKALSAWQAGTAEAQWREDPHRPAEVTR